MASYWVSQERYYCKYCKVWLSNHQAVSLCGVTFDLLTSSQKKLDGLPTSHPILPLVAGEDQGSSRHYLLLLSPLCVQRRHLSSPTLVGMPRTHNIPPSAHSRGDASKYYEVPAVDAPPKLFLPLHSAQPGHQTVG